MAWFAIVIQELKGRMVGFLHVVNAAIRRNLVRAGVWRYIWNCDIQFCVCLVHGRFKYSTRSKIGTLIWILLAVLLWGWGIVLISISLLSRVQQEKS